VALPTLSAAQSLKNSGLALSTNGSVVGPARKSELLESRKMVAAAAPDALCRGLRD
jgi:hypothetical protein